MTFIPSPFISATTQKYCVVATNGPKKKRADISGPLTISEAQDRALSLKGDAYHKRAAALPYPYKAKKAKGTKK